MAQGGHRMDLADLVKPVDIIESRFGPVLGTHLGPNTIGVAVEPTRPGRRNDMTAIVWSGW